MHDKLIAAAVSSTANQRKGKALITNLEEAAALTMGDLLQSRDEKIQLTAAKEILSLNQRYVEADSSNQTDLNKSLSPAALAAAVAGLASLGFYLGNNQDSSNQASIKQAEDQAMNLIDPSDLSAYVAENMKVSSDDALLSSLPDSLPVSNNQESINQPSKLDASSIKIIESTKGTKTRYGKHRT